MLRFAAELKRWISVTVPGVDCVAFETGLVCEVAGDGALYNFRHRRQQLGLRGK